MVSRGGAEPRSNADGEANILCIDQRFPFLSATPRLRVSLLRVLCVFVVQFDCALADASRWCGEAPHFRGKDGWGIFALEG
jgi:hypothetical protein